jgi:hypothetical protein
VGWFSLVDLGRSVTLALFNATGVAVQGMGAWASPYLRLGRMILALL